MTAEIPSELQPRPAGSEVNANSHEDLLREAREHLTQLLKQRGVATVIYVDDKNSPEKQPEIQVDLIITTISSGRLSPEIIRATEALAGLIARSDELSDDEAADDGTAVENLLGRLQLDPPDLSPEELTSLTDAARAIQQAESLNNPARVKSEEATVPTDLDALHELRELIAVEDYRAINLAEWTSNKDTVLATRTPTVLLFDRDFSQEGGSAAEGDKLLLEALGRNNANLVCGLLTHGATSDDREIALVDEIASTSGVDRVDLIVISKQSVTRDPEALPRKLKAALLNGPLKALRDAVIEGYASASTNAIDGLKDLSAYTIAGLVQAADSEGVHGADNLLRVAATRVRLRISRAVRQSSAVEDALTSIRGLDRLGPQGNDLPRADVAELLQKDRYDEGGYLADLHLPLEPGDIFERCDPTDLLAGVEPGTAGRRYVLLVQGCDIMVRSRGERADNPQSLTLARLKQFPKVPEVKAYDHALVHYDATTLADTHEWRVQSISRVHIPTVALDACVLSSGGEAILTVGAGVPIGMPTGWTRRHAFLQNWVTARIKEYQLLANTAKLDANQKLRTAVVESLTGTSRMTSEIVCEIDVDGRRIAFGLRRIGRVSHGDARVILANAGHYIARPYTDGMLFPVEQTSQS